MLGLLLFVFNALSNHLHFVGNCLHWLMVMMLWVGDVASYLYLFYYWCHGPTCCVTVRCPSVRCAGHAGQSCMPEVWFRLIMDLNWSLTQGPLVPHKSYSDRIVTSNLKRTIERDCSIAGFFEGGEIALIRGVTSAPRNLIL